MLADRSGPRDTAGAACRMQQMTQTHGELGTRVRVKKQLRDPDQIDTTTRDGSGWLDGWARLAGRQGGTTEDNVCASKNWYISGDSRQMGTIPCFLPTPHSPPLDPHLVHKYTIQSYTT